MFVRYCAGIACVFTVTGCSGSQITGTAPVFYTNQTFSGHGVTLAAPSGNAPIESNVSVVFDASGNPLLSVDGIAVSLVDQGGGIYGTSGGQYAMGVGNGVGTNTITPDADYYVIQNNLSGNTSTVYVDGNKTAPSAITGLPTATYSGGTQFASNGLNWSRGTIDLTVNFQTGDVTGNLNGLNAAPAAVLTLVPDQLNGTSFETDLTSTDITLTGASITGDLFGANAASAAGTLRVSTAGTHAIGLFGANR